MQTAPRTSDAALFAATSRPAPPGVLHPVHRHPLRSQPIAHAAVTAASRGGRSSDGADAGHGPAIRCRDVSVSYPAPGGAKRQVLTGAYLEVARGSLHMLLGPNGCGKSTLLRVIGGLLKPQAGHVEVDTPVGFVFQNPDHQVVMPTVAADVAFGLGRRVLPKYALEADEVLALVHDSLSRVGMAGFEERPSHTLSGGQKQRVAIAGALAQRPMVLLLDELTTFLDGEDQGAVLAAVRALTRPGAGVTALWVTHRLEELEHADSASYITDGRVQVSGSADRVADHLRSLGARF